MANTVHGLESQLEGAEHSDVTVTVKRFGIFGLSDTILVTLCRQRGESSYRNEGQSAKIDSMCSRATAAEPDYGLHVYACISQHNEVAEKS